MKDLVAIAGEIAARLIERRQTIAVAESSTGGLISAALLAVPGASAYFLGSAVVYTRDARRILMDIPDEAMKGSVRPLSPTQHCSRARSAIAFPPIGACPRPAPPGRPATAMETPPAIAAWRSRVCSSLQ